MACMPSVCSFEAIGPSYCSPASLAACTHRRSTCRACRLTAICRLLLIWSRPLRRTPHLAQIYLQGLLINCHREGILYQRQLEEHIILEAIEFADQHGVTLTGGQGKEWPLGRARNGPGGPFRWLSLLARHTACKPSRVLIGMA